MKSWCDKGLRRIAILALLVVAARSYGQAQTATRGQTSPAGAPVVAVRIVTEDGRVLSESPSGAVVEIGKPLDRDQVARSIHALYGTGDYEDLKAVATPGGSGVRLDFVVRENLFFNKVLIEGLTPPPTDASAAAAMQLSLGRPFRQEEVDEGLRRLRDVLKEEGLYAAQARAAGPRGVYRLKERHGVSRCRTSLPTEDEGRRKGDYGPHTARDRPDSEISRKKRPP
jgi:outer membrane protein assembly factor BamA